MAYESAPKVNRVDLGACAYLMQCLWNYVRLSKKKYMNTLISTILIHLLLVDYFPIHICLAPGFINHKCTVVPCVIVSMLDASHH